MLPWDCDGKITPPPKDMRDIVMITGVDPYHWKGTLTNVTTPYLRAETERATA